MRVLITGSSGFVGRYVIDELKSAGHDVIRFDSRETTPPPSEPEFIGDLLDPECLRNIIAEEKPGGCVHLAGIAFVPMGWSDPLRVMSVNVNGVLNLLEAFREQGPKTRILVVTSSEVYGREPRNHAFREDDPLRPSNLYAVSKMAADLSALLYARQYGMPVMTARPQNHIGPGQSSRFVTMAFSEQLAEIARGQRDPVMRVGNLDSKRDFLDVRDVARAYRLLLEQGRAGHAYNIASGKLIRIRAILETLMNQAGVQPRIEIDPDRYRPTDRPLLLNTDRLRRDTGWEPNFSIEDTLNQIYRSVLEEQKPQR